jgi:predicted transcriptional regulator
MYIYIMEMARTQIYLSRDENDALDKKAQATGRSKSQLIREAIDALYLKRQHPRFEEALERSWGSWQRRNESGEKQVERLRSGRLGRLHEK